MPCVLNDFYLNYGWQHFWCDPCKNSSLKHFIKGPFSNPKLALPSPYISLDQTEGEPLEIRTGIPDCWGDYLIHRLVGDYDSMHKEDVDIAHKLRKDYRIYLGQGIPNPCIAPRHPGFTNCKGLKESLRKYLSQIFDSRSKNRKGNCLCCEKNYLLECPDKSNTKNRMCTCKTCHTRSGEYEDECRCIEILQNWASEDIHLKERRRSGGKKNQVRYCSSGSSGSETDDEGTIVSSRKTCLCPKMVFNNISSGNSNASCMEQESKHEEYIFGRDFLYKGFTEKKGFGFFPYTRYRKNKRLRFKDIKAASKQIQTEMMGDTKTVQTENAGSKMQNSSKCFRCTLYQHQYSTCKLKPFEKYSCISPGMVKNRAIICPYNCHDEGRKLYCVGSVEKNHSRKEMPKKGKSGDYQRNRKMEDCLYKISNINSSKLNQPCLKSFDNLKYLTDSRLKNYIRERETLRRFHNKTSQTGRMIREEPREKLEKLKFLERKPKSSNSFHAESPRRNAKYVDRGVMAGGGEGIRKKEIITKYFKDVESDESRTYGLVRSRESNRKRRKLVCSRKRRKMCGGKKLENRAWKSKNEQEVNEKSPRDANDVIKFRECNFKFKQIADESEKPELGRTHRSPDVMKFIVGDLIIDEK